MRSRQPVLFYIIAALVIIGIVTQLLQGSRDLVIAVIVFGTVFLLYKYPPRRLKGMIAKKQQRPGTRRTKRKFRVIEGNRRDGDDDPPKYH